MRIISPFIFLLFGCVSALGMHNSENLSHRSQLSLRRPPYQLPILAQQQQRTSPMTYRIEREITISIPGESAGVMYTRKMWVVVDFQLDTAQKAAILRLLVTHRKKTVTEHKAFFNW